MLPEDDAFCQKILEHSFNPHQSRKD